MKRKLFKKGKDQSLRACFGWQNKDTALLGVKMGYKDSADKLVEEALAEGEMGNNRVLDTFIFPICFLYRNSIEVSLKDIYMRFCKEIPPGGHDLVKIWDHLYKNVVLYVQEDEFKNEVKKYKENFREYSFDGIDFNELRSLLNEFNKVNDQKADVFRYLVDKKGELYFTDSRFIDYPNLKETMNYIYEVLDYIHTVVDEYLSS